MKINPSSIVFSPILSRKNKDLTGTTFSRLTVIGYAGGCKWYCLCGCGSYTATYATSLRLGLTKSCGCLNVETVRTRSRIHGAAANYTPTPEYMTWGHIKQRCLNQKKKSYKNYGGRGIRVCDRWLDSFENFIADMGPRPSPRHSIDRINNDGDYEPDNCRWATAKEQSCNTRRNRRIAFNGETKTFAEWEASVGLSKSSLRSRLKTMSIHDALTRPPNMRYSHPKCKINH